MSDLLSSFINISNYFNFQEKSAWIDGGISSLVCIRDELMVATKTSHVVRQKWDGTANRDYSLDLRRIPFSVDQQISTVAVPITENNVYVLDIEYSPLVGGFAIVLSNGKAAFLTAQSLKFDPNVGSFSFTTFSFDLYLS